MSGWTHFSSLRSRLRFIFVYVLSSRPSARCSLNGVQGQSRAAERVSFDQVQTPGAFYAVRCAVNSLSRSAKNGNRVTERVICDLNAGARL